MYSAQIKALKQNGKNLGDKKGLWRAYSLVTIGQDGKMIEAVCARVYGTKGGMRVYASVWIHGTEDRYASGHGTAGGGGDPAAASLTHALESAGVALFEDGKPCEITDSGTGQLEDVFTAMARAFGYDGQTFLVNHG
jgi:hypothetical protein